MWTDVDRSWSFGVCNFDQGSGDRTSLESRIDL